MSFYVIIPARYSSSRLPGKPLMDLGGKPLIQRVYEVAKKSDAKGVIVATDHEDIINCCDSFGASTVSTSTTHLTGTDRIAETVEKIGLSEDSVVVNLQGDEPFLDFHDINNLFEFYIGNKKFDVCTLYSQFTNQEEQGDPNLVKIWVDKQGYVKGFSRKQDYLENNQLVKGRHIGIYIYEVGFIKQFVKWHQTVNEQKENLEQLRALDKNKAIGARESISKVHIGIDTEEDLTKARSLLLND